MKKSNPESTPFIAFYLRRPSCIYTASQLSAPPETAKGGAHMDSAFLTFYIIHIIIKIIQTSYELRRSSNYYSQMAGWLDT